MSEVRRICIVTGSRADYSLLRGLMLRLREDPRALLQVTATGMHLASSFGNTWQEIVNDGFSIDARIDCLLANDSGNATAKAVGLGIIGFADAFARLTPDLVVVLGDRFEILAAVQAALFTRLPIAHIHGGELTAGAIDDAIRHAISKMAHLHFVSAPPYRRRLIQLGENPEHIRVVGAPGVDNLHTLNLPARTELLTDLGLQPELPYLLVTYHPETLAETPPHAQIAALLTALDEFPEKQLLITGANADPGHAAIGHRLVAYAAAHPDRIRHVTSLGPTRYLAAMKHCLAVVGNSSSGLIEAPAAGVPTVNIGSRQDGRLRAPSVIDVPAEPGAIAAAIRQATTPSFRTAAQTGKTLFGDGRAAERIAKTLLEYPLAGLCKKTFHDLAEGMS